MCWSRSGDIWPARYIHADTHVKAGYAYSGAATGTAGQPWNGADRAPGAERARLLHDQRTVPRENRAGGVRDARGAVRGSGVWRGGDHRARPGEEARALLTPGAAPRLIVIAGPNRAGKKSSPPD